MATPSRSGTTTRNAQAQPEEGRELLDGVRRQERATRVDALGHHQRAHDEHRDSSQERDPDVEPPDPRVIGRHQPAGHPGRRGGHRWRSGRRAGRIRRSGVRFLRSRVGDRHAPSRRGSGGPAGAGQGRCPGDITHRFGPAPKSREASLGGGAAGHHPERTRTSAAMAPKRIVMYEIENVRPASTVAGSGRARGPRSPAEDRAEHERGHAVDPLEVGDGHEDQRRGPQGDGVGKHAPAHLLGRSHRRQHRHRRPGSRRRSGWPAPRSAAASRGRSRRTGRWPARPGRPSRPSSR